MKQKKICRSEKNLLRFCPDRLNLTTVRGIGKGGIYLIQMATGLGKTVTFANIQRKGRVLLLSHREELVTQPQKYYDCSFGIEQGKYHSDGEEVVSASVQSIVRRLDNFKPDDFDMIICDEAHHAAANTYKKIFSYFKPRLLLGFTATPNRADGVRLNDVFSEIIFKRDLRWGIKNGYLSDIFSGFLNELNFYEQVFNKSNKYQ